MKEKVYKGRAFDTSILADGNMTNLPVASGTGGGWTLYWDAENRLTEIANATTRIVNTFDSQHRRVRKQVYTDNTLVTDAAYLYDGWNLVAETISDPQSTHTNFYIWGADRDGSMDSDSGGVGGLLAIIRDTTVYYPVMNHHGDVMALIDDSGSNIVARYEYDPWGVLLSATGPAVDACPFRWQTKYIDAETGLYYFGYRFFDSLTGRWLSRDPLQEEGGVNLYAFCGNDPVNGVDPLGLRDKLWTGKGHHIAVVSVVESIWDRTGRWTDDVIKALNCHTIGLKMHDGSAHDQYNLRVRVYIEAYLDGTKLDPTKVKGKEQAKEFAEGLVRAIEESGDDYVGEYLKMLRRGASKNEIGAFGRSYKAASERGEKWYFRRASESGRKVEDVASIVSTRGSPLRRSGQYLARKGARALLGGLSVMFVATMATETEASDAIAGVLPPGAGFAWMAAEELVDWGWSSAKDWAENDYFPTSKDGYGGEIGRLGDIIDNADGHP